LRVVATVMEISMARGKLTRTGDDGPSSLEGTMSHVTLMVDPTELKLGREHSAKIAVAC
jgi:hypothetical protein